MNRSEYFSSDFTKLGFARSVMNLPFQHQTAFNTGEILPIMVEPVYPGDTWKSKISYLLRLFTPMKQIFNNMYIDFYAFFVPHRLTWTHWANFLGQNDSAAWTQTNTYTIPQCMITLEGEASKPDYLDPGCFGAYLGINYDVFSAAVGQQLSISAVSVSDLFRRGYIEIFNQWWRDENIISPILYSKGDSTVYDQRFSGSTSGGISGSYGYSDPLLKAAKFHDYFTVLLPEPMKGTPPVIGSDLPVVAGDVHVDDASKFVAMKVGQKTFDGATGSYIVAQYGAKNSSGVTNVSPFATGQFLGLDSTVANANVVPSNLWATMTITIEDIRKAAVATHVMEKLATSGTRYPEFLLGMWSVQSSNAELQIPELLGSQRFPIRIAEVVSNADTATSGSGNLLGATGAMVKTGDSGALFNKAFTEYGLLFVEGVVRIEQNYFQGLARKFTDKSFFDFYLPALANIGNQPVEKNRLVAGQTGVLGYSEAWAHLRHIPYLVTSIMRPDVPNGLSSWSASDIYSASNGNMALNQAFIEQNAAGLDRCIAIPSSTRGAFQWFGEFKLDNEVTRIIPPHGTPGVGRI